MSKLDNLKSLESKGFEIKEDSQSLYKVVKDNPKDKIEVELGDSKDSTEFYPQAKIKRWDNEVNLSVRYLGLSGTKEVKIDGNKISCEDKNTKVRLYELDGEDNDQGYILPIVDTKIVRGVHLGALSAKDFGSTFELPRKISPNNPMITTYWQEGDDVGYAFYGHKPAHYELEELSNLPVTRYNTLFEHMCPITYIAGGVFVVDIYYPGLKNNTNLSVVDRSINKALERFGGSIFRSGIFFEGHMILYKKGLQIFRVGRTAFDEDHLSIYLYLESPTTLIMLENVRKYVKNRDTVLTKIGGLKDLNVDIDHNIVREISDNLLVELGLTEEEEPLTNKELQELKDITKEQGVDRFRNLGEISKIPQIPNYENGFEFDVVLTEKPVTNVLSFSIETKNVEFLYQGELDEEGFVSGAYRPEFVIGSYAIYYKDTPKNTVDSKDYLSGKFGHIYRPLVKDSANNWVWGELNIVGNILSVTIPQEFLNNGVYPIVVDPTFGYTTAGSSLLILSTNKTPQVHTRRGYRSTLSADAEVSKLTVSIRTVDGTGKITGGIYNNDANRTKNSQTSETLVSAGDKSWKDISFSSSVDLSAGDYWLLIAGQYTGSGSGANLEVAYDSGTANYGVNKNVTYGTWDNDLQGYTANNNKLSIYATYEESVVVTPVIGTKYALPAFRNVV